MFLSHVSTIDPLPIHLDNRPNSGNLNLYHRLFPSQPSAPTSSFLPSAQVDRLDLRRALTRASLTHLVRRHGLTHFDLRHKLDYISIVGLRRPVSSVDSSQLVSSDPSRPWAWSSPSRSSTLLDC